MPVVPFSPQGARAPALPPLDPHYLLMAAAQMHDAGRLIQPGSEPTIPDTVQDRPDLTPPEPQLRTPSNGQRNGPSMMT